MNRVLKRITIIVAGGVVLAAAAWGWSLVAGDGCRDSGWDPAWFPDSRRIVFNYVQGCDKFSEARWWVADVDGDDRHQLASPAELPPTLQAPEVSPSGDSVAFVSRGGVYSMAVDGSHLQRIARDGDGGLSWSRDGLWVAYVVSRFGDLSVSYDELIVVRVDGSVRRRLGDVGGRRLVALYGPTPTRWPVEVRPAWSPDGRWIAAEVDDAIDLIGTDGRTRRQLVAAGHNPSWSPDGREILVVTDDGIVFVRPDGTNRRPFLGPSDMPPVGNAVWSPDGRRIAFWTGYDIYTIRSDGTELRRIT